MMVFFAVTGRGQRDSSRIDMGWLSLDKNLSQTISIKGDDLEKMPFTNLSDAIGAWLYGAYAKPGTLAYVVDGNPVTDVNIYPIYDIEEVTLVMSAVGGAAYGGTQQELVLVTTRRGKGKSGVHAAAQVGPVNANGNGRSTATNFYHQYYLGAYRNGEKFSGGLSVDWVRDVEPFPKGAGYEVVTPENLQRFRLNGYLRWTPTKTDIVELRMSYAPERLTEDVDSMDGAVQARQTLHSHLILPTIRWSSEIAPGLRSDLQGSYVGSSVNAGFGLFENPSNTGVPQEAEDTTLSRINHFFVRERLSYELSAGSWLFVPGVNLSYEHIDEKTATSADSLSFSGTGQPIIVDVPVGPWLDQKGDLLFVSPAIEVRLARAMDLQFGAQMNLSGKRDLGSKVVLPFATVGFDVLHFGHRGGGASLKVFGSYAQRQLVFLNDYSMEDFSGAGNPYSLADVYQPRYSKYTFGSYSPITGLSTETWLVNNPPKPLFWTGQAGLAYTTANGRLRLQYSYEQRKFLTPGGTAYLNSTGGGQQELLQWTSDMHHIDIRFKVIDSGSVHWETGLNVTALKSKSHLDVPDNLTYLGLAGVSSELEFPQAGDVDPAHLSYSGGWVNRFRAGNWLAGLDLLYHFGESSPDFNGFGGVNWMGPKVNSVLASNVYVGYAWPLRSARKLEVFVESRGLARSKKSDVLDDRRYYTVGGKFSM